MDYQNAYEYVKSKFHDAEGHKRQYGFREKWSHTERVVQWAKRLSKKVEVREDVLIMAAIFHDVGYTVARDVQETSDPDNHAVHSERICRDYLEKKSYPQDYIETVCDAILKHGDKELLRADNPNLEQVLLIEADCLDENGAMSIIRDAVLEGAKSDTSYETVYERILRYPLNEEKFDCVTDAAREIWEEKRHTYWEFVRSLERDVKP